MPSLLRYDSDGFVGGPVAREGVDESERAAVVDRFERDGFGESFAETDADVNGADRTPGEH